MPDIAGWRVHRTGTSGGLVLAVDFPISGRGEAGFADLAAGLQTSHTVWETLPEQATSGPISGAAEIARWLPAVRASGLTVTAILSFCAGAAFVDALAAGIAEFQEHRPEQVLFDPEIPVAVTLYTQHARAIGRFDTLYSADELATLHREAYENFEACDGDIEALIASVVAHFDRVAQTGFERAGIDPRHGRGLSDAFVWFSRYLVAGAQLKSAPRWPDAVAISSRTTSNGLHRLPPELRADAVGREITVDVDHVELLSHPEVVARTESLLGQPVSA